MKLSQRWKQTSIHNQGLVLTGVLVAAGTIIYAAAAVVQICIMRQAARDSSAQVERLSRATDEAIKKAVESSSQFLDNSMKQNTTSFDSALTQEKAALEASIAQSKIALDASIAASRNDQRAWIGIVSISGADFAETIGETTRRAYLKEGEPISIGPVIQNSGKSIAINMSNCAKFETVVNDHPFIPGTCTPEEGSVTVLQPGVPMTVTSDSPPGFKVTKGIMDALRLGKTRLYLYGWIKYDDVFNRPHSVTFCVFLSPDLASFGAYGKKYNQAD